MRTNLKNRLFKKIFYQNKGTFNVRINQIYINQLPTNRWN